MEKIQILNCPIIYRSENGPIFYFKKEIEKISTNSKIKYDPSERTIELPIDSNKRYYILSYNRIGTIEGEPREIREVFVFYNNRRKT